MSDLQLKMISLGKILDSDLSKHEKIIRACKCLSGLDITNVSLIVKNILEDHIYKMNKILSRYTTVIKTWDDYKHIKEGDLNRILKNFELIRRYFTLD